MSFFRLGHATWLNKYWREQNLTSKSGFSTFTGLRCIESNKNLWANRQRWSGYLMVRAVLP